nr:MAG TPA: hypothetical protein [Caudoviricetes sp.]
MSVDLIKSKIRKMEIKLAMFLSVYWIYCFSWFLVNLVKIVNGGGLYYSINGAIQVSCLFLAAMMIEDLLNEH